MTFTQFLVEEKAKKLRSDLENQLKEELKSDNENPVPNATMASLRQKFGLAFDPRSVKEIAKDLQKCRRLQ